MKWWKILVSAVSALVLFWRERFSRRAKAKRKAYEDIEKKIDEDDSDADIHSRIDDLINRL